MLSNLKISNIAIIKDAVVDFNDGLNVLTGETGAGKSIIIDAINAILGERTSRELIRTDSNNAEVSAYLGNLGLSRPVSGAITSRYGNRSRGFHTGLDIATAAGTGINSIAPGTVTYAGTKGSYGKLIVIDHGEGIVSYYAHCSAIYVSVGQSVTNSTLIGAVGSTGNSTGPHLHLEIRVNGNTINPQNYLY